MEEAVAELKAAFERDPTGFASDELTRSILERLNNEVAALYSTADEGDADDGGDDEDTAGDISGPVRGNPRVHVELQKGPRPYDLWKEAHEINQAVKEVSCGDVRGQQNCHFLCSNVFYTLSLSLSLLPFVPFSVEY